MRRSGYKKSEQSRRQVVDAAVATLAERGITNTSVQDIASAAGLSKGAVHYHFESKDELLERVLERCCEVLEERARAAFEAPADPIERIRRALLELWVIRRDAAPEFRVLSDLNVLAHQNEAMRGALGAAMRRAREQIVTIGLTKLVELGFRPKVALGIAPRLLVAMLDGLALQHAIDPISPEDEAELLRALETMALSLFELPG